MVSLSSRTVSGPADSFRFRIKVSLLGRLRRLIHPTLKFCLLRSSASKTVRINGLTDHVSPTVFHPRYFGSSSILGDYLSGLELARLRVLDMKTGSGVIGLRAARAGALVTALDINPAAVACAKENACVNGLAVEVLESDLFVAVEGRKFDLIAWNPPFFVSPVSAIERATVDSQLSDRRCYRQR